MNQVQTEHDRIANAVYDGLQAQMVLTPTAARSLTTRLMELQTSAGRLEASLAEHKNGRVFARLMRTIRENAAAARELVDESVAEQRSLPL